MKIITIILVFIATIIGAFGGLMMKKGSKNFSYNPFKNIKNYKLVFGVILYSISSLFYLAALRLDDVTVVYPITSLSYIWIALLSIKYLNEKMNLLKWSGIFLIIAGIILITI